MAEAAEEPRAALVRAAGRLDGLGAELRRLARAAAAAKQADAAPRARLQAEAGLAIMELKRRSREAFGAAAALLETLDAAKKSAEDRQLSLQNLLYEKAYLRREIERCRKFELKEHAKIDLVPREDFERTAPAALIEDIKSLPEGSQEQAHQLNLSRLSHELQLRRDLEQKLKALREDVSAVTETTSEQIAFLEHLPGKMQDIVKAIKPVQDHFGDRVIERLARHELCRELPRPLYMIYCQLEAYGDSFGGVSVRVQKDEAAVKRAALREDAQAAGSGANGRPETANKEKGDDDDDDDNDDDDDDDDDADMAVDDGPAATTKKTKRSASASTKKRRASSVPSKKATKAARVEPKETKEDDGLVESGYAVLASLASPNRQEVDVSLIFKFYPSHDVVTVEAENQRGLLANIFPNDTGQYLPRASVDATTAQNARRVFPKDRPDRPYKWLQWLSGSYNLAPEGPGAEAQPSMGSIVKSILDRVGAQEALSEQLHALKKCPHPVPVHPSAESLFPSKASTRLVKWEEMAAAEADDLIASTQVSRASGAPLFHRRNAGSASSSSSWTKFGRRCFHGVMETADKTRVEAIVQVYVDYPQRAPHFTLLPTSNSTLRIIQTEVNDHADELRAADQLRLLSHQLRRLQMCLDVMAASQTATSSSSSPLGGDQDAVMDEAAGETSAGTSAASSASSSASKMDRKLRGRDRRLAFVYDPPSRSFTHR